MVSLQWPRRYIDQLIQTLSTHVVKDSQPRVAATVTRHAEETFQLVAVDKAAGRVRHFYCHSHYSISNQSNSGATIAVGGPLLTSYLIPTEEELVKKFSPEVMKIREETKDARMQYAQEFDEYVTRLKRYSKSDKPSRDHTQHNVL